MKQSRYSGVHYQDEQGKWYRLHIKDFKTFEHEYVLDPTYEEPQFEVKELEIDSPNLIDSVPKVEKTFTALEVR